MFGPNMLDRIQEVQDLARAFNQGAAIALAALKTREEFNNPYQDEADALIKQYREGMR